MKKKTAKKKRAPKGPRPKRFKMKVTVPTLQEYLGREVNIPGLILPIVIESIVGNVGMTIGYEKPKPQYYEINGEHLISMLRFHAQMEGDSSITEEQFQAFEEMEFHSEKMVDERSA